MLKKHLIAVLVVSGLLVQELRSQSVLSDEFKENVRARVEYGIHTGIVVGMVDHGEVEFFSVGLRSVGGTKPVDEKTVFEIGSITKTFTGLLLADQVLKDKMSLDDPIQKFLPEGIKAPVFDGDSIQLVHLTNHTSSLPRLPDNIDLKDATNPYAKYSEKQLYDFLSEYQLGKRIGSEYEYSNYGAGLLGYLISQLNNKSYGQMISRSIVKPLGLKSTGVGLIKKMHKNLARGHHEGHEVSNWDFNVLAGAGAILSSPTDMMKYLRANMDGGSPLDSSILLTHKSTYSKGKMEVGLGWHISVSKEKKIFWHNGGTGGYRSFIGFDKEAEKGVVILSNSTVIVDDLAAHLLNPKKHKLAPVKKPIGLIVKRMIEEKGLEVGLKKYAGLKESELDTYDFGEKQLRKLGIDYMRAGQLDHAVAIFNLNVQEYTSSYQAYKDLADAYKRLENHDLAIENYKKVLQLNPAQKEASEELKDLGYDIASLKEEVTLIPDILDSCVGQYELAPGFILSVLVSEGQLMAQATGQPSFQIFPSADYRFYYKVIDAQLEFNRDEGGIVESVTLFQGGQELVGKKLN